jgi:chromosome segregation ATPase
MIMGLLDIIRGKKESSSPDELISASRELQAKLTELDQEEQELEAEARGLQLEVAIDGKDSKKLKDIQLKRLDLPEKKKALEGALDEIKARLLETMPKLKEDRLREIDGQVATLKQKEAKHLPELLHHLAQAACLMEVVFGVEAEKWKSKLVPIAGDVQAIVRANRDDFIVQLDKTMDEIPVYRKAGNTRKQISLLRDEYATLQRSTFIIEDAELMIETGHFPVGPLREPRPIRPHISSMVG